MMGCFLPCFGASKRRTHTQLTNATRSSSGDQKLLQTHVTDAAPYPAEQSVLTEKKIVEGPIHYITESKIKLEEPSKGSARKRVTFDINANTNEDFSTKELKQKQEGSNDEQEKAKEEKTPQISAYPKVIAISRASNLSDYRYRDCENINLDEGDFGDAFIDDDLDDEKKAEDEKHGDENKKLLQEESSESLFSLSIDSRKQGSAPEKSDNEVNSPMPLRGAFCSKKEESEAFGSSHSAYPSSNCIGKRKVTFDLNEEANEESSAKNLIKGLKDNNVEQEKAREEESSLSNLFMNRCQPCSDEGFGDINIDESDFGDSLLHDGLKIEKKGKDREGHGVNRTWVEEEPSESLFSLSTDSRRRVPAFEKSENEVNSPMKVQSKVISTDEETKDKEGGGVNRTWVEEESSESLFSLSADSTKRDPASEKVENEVNSPMEVRGKVISTDEETKAFGSIQSTKARFQDVSSVLNPIENITEGKVVKLTAIQPSMNEKENINSLQEIDIHISPEPNLNLSIRKARQKLNDKKQEIGVDTSLSSWLIEPEATTPKFKNSTVNSARECTSKGGRGSPMSHEDRPILGALTIEELRKFSLTSTSSRRSKSRSPDETHIMGTVGSYWSHTGRTMDSDSSSSYG